MDKLLGEISQTRTAMGMGLNDQKPSSSGFNPYAADGQAPPQGRPSDDYSDAELKQIYDKIQSGNCPPEMAALFQQLSAGAANGTLPDGKPIIDAEGGTVIQPKKGFVVKTKDMKTGGKLFINMTQHEHVDPFETKPIPKDQQDEHGAADQGLRIPLSLGDIREESDKKGDPAQVVDVIWAPATVEKAKRDAAFRQIVVELAFNYILQKYNIELDLRYTVPKLNYKGATVQFQRVRARKTPKIQEVELTQEQREELEKRNLEEQKIKEALAEKKPTWKLYYSLQEEGAQMLTKEYWTKLVDEQFEQKVGDEEDRWNTLRESFSLDQSLGVFEEFDGLNHFDGKFMVLMVSLPLMMRGGGVHMQILDDIFSLRVTNLYKLQLSLPVAVEHTECLSFFDCKLRKMIVVAPVQNFEEEDEAPAPEPVISAPETTLVEEQKDQVEQEERVAESVPMESDDLLFDVV